MSTTLLTMFIINSLIASYKKIIINPLVMSKLFWKSLAKIKFNRNCSKNQKGMLNNPQINLADFIYGYKLTNYSILGHKPSRINRV